MQGEKKLTSPYMNTVRAGTLISNENPIGVSPFYVFCVMFFLWFICAAWYLFL